MRQDYMDRLTGVALTTAYVVGLATAILCLTFIGGCSVICIREARAELEVTKAKALFIEKQSDNKNANLRGVLLALTKAK